MPSVPRPRWAWAAETTEHRHRPPSPAAASPAATSSSATAHEAAPGGRRLRHLGGLPLRTLARPAVGGPAGGCRLDPRRPGSRVVLGPRLTVAAPRPKPDLRPSRRRRHGGGGPGMQFSFEARCRTGSTGATERSDRPAPSHHRQLSLGPLLGRLVRRRPPGRRRPMGSRLLRPRRGRVGEPHPRPPPPRHRRGGRLRLGARHRAIGQDAVSSASSAPSVATPSAPLSPRFRHRAMIGGEWSRQCPTLEQV
jgi:hypothetical protein